MHIHIKVFGVVQYALHNAGLTCWEFTFFPFRQTIRCIAIFWPSKSCYNRAIFASCALVDMRSHALTYRYKLNARNHHLVAQRHFIAIYAEYVSFAHAISIAN